jgi:hypothetical protein
MPGQRWWSFSSNLLPDTNLGTRRFWHIDPDCQHNGCDCTACSELSDWWHMVGSVPPNAGHRSIGGWTALHPLTPSSSVRTYSLCHTPRWVASHAGLRRWRWRWGRWRRESGDARRNLYDHSHRYRWSSNAFHRARFNPDGELAIRKLCQRPFFQSEGGRCLLAGSLAREPDGSMEDSVVKCCQKGLSGARAAFLYCQESKLIKPAHGEIRRLCIQAEALD